MNKWPKYSKEEIKLATSILKSGKVNYWTGEEGKKFEEEFSSWCGVSHSIALSNGSLALELALRGLDIGLGDEVIVTPRSFIASVSCVVNVGAKPIFADVDKDSGNLTAETISSVLTPKTKAVICVHLAGWPCEMLPIMELSDKHSFYVIEDCAQAHGAKYNGKNVGSIGHIGAWSFCQDKIMTTGGEGGMVTTNNLDLWKKMWAFKEHGKNFDTVFKKDHPPGFRWLHESYGSNFRMTEIQATLGRVQLKKMSSWHEARSNNAKFFKEICDNYPSILRTPFCSENSQHAFYRFYTYVRNAGLKDGWNRDRIINEINMCGVPCFSGSCSEIYLESVFENADFKPQKRLTIAKELGEMSLAFLVHPTLSKENISQVRIVMSKIFAQAVKN